MSRSPEKLALPPPSSHTVFVALSGSSKSKYVVTWALEKFSPEGNVGFKLLHIHPRITSVPTPSKAPTNSYFCFFLALRISCVFPLVCCVKTKLRLYCN